MAYYKVTKIMMYSEDVYVEANSRKDAEELASEQDGTPNHDDHWYDTEIEELTKEEYEDI